MTESISEVPSGDLVARLDPAQGRAVALYRPHRLAFAVDRPSAKADSRVLERVRCGIEEAVVLQLAPAAGPSSPFGPVKLQVPLPATVVMTPVLSVTLRIR